MRRQWRPHFTPPAPALVLGGVVGLEGGAVVAATVIPAAGIVGTVMLRVGFGAIGLLALGRPSLRGLDRRSVLLMIAVGSLLAAHHRYRPCHPAGGFVRARGRGLLGRLHRDLPAAGFVPGTKCRVVAGYGLGRRGGGAPVAADVISYSLQSEALGRMRGSLFSILTSTEPAVGALFGLVALGQQISLLQWGGMIAVVAASIGATAIGWHPTRNPA
jgi:threonine/homoserine efflux transporter RhtA